MNETIKLFGKVFIIDRTCPYDETSICRGDCRDCLDVEEQEYQKERRRRQKGA